MKMSTYKCEFCNNEYVNSKILKNHQKTAKFCIEIQKKPKIKPIINTLIYCFLHFL